MLKNKIVLITTSQPSANPRLVKEADVLSESGYDVYVLYCYVADWAQKFDESLLQKVKWNYKQIGGENKKSISYKRSRFFYAIYKIINKIVNFKIFPERAHARCYKALLKEAIKLNADYYIGHNPGAMAIAANAAVSTKAKAGFDFEDYYRGEFLDINSIEVRRQIYLEKKYIEKFSYLTAASLLIKEKVQEDFLNMHVPFVALLNSFSLKEQPVFRRGNNVDLKLFWFSQHVGKNRGLQIVCEVLREINDPNINLTLAGNCSKEMKDYFIQQMAGLESNIFFAGIIAPDNLPSFSSQFDVGLALEPAFSVNNNLALANKIFTYLHAGNGIILSETAMQKHFNEKYKVGQTFPIGNKIKLKECILFYKNGTNLFEQRQSNFLLASKELNWENESKKLLALIN